MPVRKRKKKIALPKYVVLKNDPPEWHVRRVFPTADRDEKGRIVYLQFSRRCIPETEDRAADIAKALELEVRQNKPEKTEPLTVGDFLEAFLQSKKKNIQPATYEFYDYLYTHIRGKRFTRLPLSDLNPRHLQLFIDEPREDPSKPELSADLTLKIHRFLNTAFEQAVRWRDIDTNPAQGLILPKPPYSEQSAFTEDEAPRFISACREKPNDIVFEFALETGMRSQEFIILRWSDINLAAGTADVRRALARKRGGGFVIKQTKTRTSNRTIDFSPELRDRLVEHKCRQDERLKNLEKELRRPALLQHMRKRGVNYRSRLIHRQTVKTLLENHKQYDLVFPSADFTPLNRHNLNRREFREALTRAGLEPKKYTLKSLRHTHATIMARYLHPKELQERMGHAKIETTMKYYVHVQHDSRQRPSSKMAGVLYGTAKAG